MKTPSTPEQLASAIESLVVSYIDEVRLAARQAVERSLAPRATVRGPSTKSRRPRPAPANPNAPRRTGAELDEVGEQLCRLVRERPGESMAALAEAMDAPPSLLQRPMAKLRAQGRVRTVGERHLTRYFPAVVRTSACKS